MNADARSLNDILDALRKAQSSPMQDPQMAALLQKSTFAQSGSATSGLTYYDLEAGAKFLYPVLTPLRNSMPRTSGKGGIQANWRAVTGVNTANVRAGVSGGNRGGVIAVSTKDYIAAYRGIGLEANVDFEAQYAAQGFDDVRAIATKNLLESLMLQEEILILGGNNSMALAQTPQPTCTPGAGGSLADGTLSVICVALTLEGVLYGSVAGGIQARIVRTNADGSSDPFGGGAAKQSTAQTASISASNLGSCACTVAAVKGAYGYAWFWGTTGNEKLGAITTINSIVIKADATGNQMADDLGTDDNSQNALVFDGLLTIGLATGAGGYYKALATGTAGTGTKLTSDTKGGVVEIDEALKWFWDNLRLTPTVIYVNSQEAQSISQIILTGSSSAAQRFTIEVKDGLIAGGVMVRSYLNKFSMTGGQEIPIKVHPNMPAGTILFVTERLPYPLSNVQNVMQIRARQDYYQIEWPLRSRKYEYGVYADEVLQHYFPPSLGVITNIAPGA